MAFNNEQNKTDVYKYLRDIFAIDGDVSEQFNEVCFRQKLLTLRSDFDFFVLLVKVLHDEFLDARKGFVNKIEHLEKRIKELEGNNA